MSESHTPGPWGWQFFGPHLALIEARGERKIILDVTPKGVVRLRKGHIMRPVTMVAECEEHPDFRLIKASPDLLAEIKMVLAEMAEISAEYTDDSSAFGNGVRYVLGQLNATKLRAAIAKAGGAA